MCEAKTFKELMDAVFDLCEERLEVNRTINIVGDLIVIDRPNEWKYEIPLKDCETICGALSWIFHMQEKTWVTQPMAKRIAALICEHNGQEFWGGN